MHFGMFLYKEGAISAEQLIEVFAMQGEQTQPLGVVAMEAGKLGVRDVLSILRVQSDLPNDRFGDIAIDLGLLTQADLAELLLRQSDSTPTVEQCLEALGILSQEQLAEELAAYRRERERGGARRIDRVASHLPEELQAELASTVQS